MELLTVIFTSTAFWRRIDITLRYRRQKKAEILVRSNTQIQTQIKYTGTINYRYTQKRKNLTPTSISQFIISKELFWDAFINVVNPCVIR